VHERRWGVGGGGQRRGRGLQLEHLELLRRGRILPMALELHTAKCLARAAAASCGFGEDVRICDRISQEPQANLKGAKLE
jgi:hypothetical protein